MYQPGGVVMTLIEVTTATAILDHFLYRAEIIQITGRSYRLKDRQANSLNPDHPKSAISTARKSHPKSP